MGHAGHRSVYWWVITDMWLVVMYDLWVENKDVSLLGRCWRGPCWVLWAAWRSSGPAWARRRWATAAPSCGSWRSRRRANQAAPCAAGSGPSGARPCHAQQHASRHLSTCSYDWHFFYRLTTRNFFTLTPGLKLSFSTIPPSFFRTDSTDFRTVTVISGHILFIF